MKTAKKILAFLLVVALIFSMTPINSNMVRASEIKDTVISVESKNALPGSTVDVEVSIKNNPGILGAVLKLSYDSKMTLTNAKTGDAFSSLVMTKPGKFDSPCQFVWDGQELNAEDIADGTILHLTFEIAETAEVGDVLDIDIACDSGDFVDTELNSVDVTLESGKISVMNYTPGDLNGDEKVNSTDVILLRRHIAGGYDITVNELAGDVNADSKVGSSDVILIRRYIAGGYGVTLKPAGDNHSHTMTEISAKEVTCTEDGNIAYWHCISCDKYYSDADGKKEVSIEDTVIESKGHTTVIDEAVSATYESTGLTEGSHCSTCNTVFVEQEVIPKLEKTQYSITYHLYEDDSYLQKQEIVNSNPEYYTSEDGLQLANIKCDGYIFEGWYDGEGANATLVKEISAGETGNRELYAHWTVREYTINFDSPLAPVDSITYKVNEGATLTNPEWFGYSFMGWTDEDNNLVDSIPKGTTGNITLQANWTSQRNLTRPVKKLGEPIIIENEEEGQYLFAYEIGQIENVPLYEIKDFGNTTGLTITETITASGSISESKSNSIVDTIANTTTRTSSWTLSKDWNNSLTVVESHTDETGKEVVDSTSTVDNESAVTVDGKVLSGSGTNSVTNKNGQSSKVGYGVSVGGNAGPVELEGKLNVEGSQSNETQKAKSLTKGWNTSESTEKSKSSSSSTSNSTALSSKVSNTYGYNTTYSEGGSEALATSDSTSTSDSHEYASALAYSTQKTETVSKTYSNEDAPEGYYRLVCAGTIHVFAVVGYDIASSSYYVYTYGVQDDDTYDFLDYSKGTHSFDDYENGILPFEVPYYVNEYIDNALLETEGLTVDIDSGTIVEYNGTSKNVKIPDYITADNGDGTTSVVKIVGIDKEVFAGNTDITSVKLSKYIEEIPDGAFEGCTSLKEITGDQIVKIGEKAFSGCTSLEEFEVSKQVTSLGDNAFDGVSKVTVNAMSTEIAEAAINSGAKHIVLSNASENAILENKTIVISDTTECFEFNGANKTYGGLKIISDAQETVINGVSITDTSGVPLKLSSSSVTLNRVTVDSSGFALILSADTTDVSLYGTVELNSSGSNAILCKNINLQRKNQNVVGKLNTSGNVMICGQIQGEDLLTVTNGEVVSINEESYEQLAQDSLEWVLESEVPEGATIVSEKWSYDLTTKITSSQQSVPGYTLYNSSWVWGSYGSWSGWTDSAISSSDSRKVETRSVVASYKTQYNYKRYLSADGKTSGPTSGTWGGKSCTNYQERGWSDTPLSVTGSQNSNQAGFFYLYGSAPCWYYEWTQSVPASYKTQYRYADRSKVYTYYHKKVENKESTTEVVASDTISNVKRWVQYVVK